MKLSILSLLATTQAADVVFAPNLDDYYGTTVDVKCSIDRGMEITLTAPLAAKGMRFMLAGDPKCRLEKNGNYHTIQTRLSGCNNEIFMDSSTLTIANTIVNTMTFGRNAVRIESPVGCLFHSQEVSIGVLMEEKIPLEIAPTPAPTQPVATTTEAPPTLDEQNEDTDDGSVDDTEAPTARGGIPIDQTTNPAADKPPSTPEDVQGQKDGSDDDEVDQETSESTKDSDSPITENQGQTAQESDNETDDEQASEDDKPNQISDDTSESNEDFTTVSPNVDTNTIEEERVNINFVTTAPTAGPKDPISRVTTTTQPRTKELVQGIILIDNGHEFEDDETEDSYDEPQGEEENVEVNIIDRPDEPANTDPGVTPRPGFKDEESGEETESSNNEVTSDENESENVDNDTTDDTSNEKDGDDDNEEESEDVLEPIDLDPRSCSTPELCRIDGRKGKGKRPKKEKKETLWRVVARGDGLFFARMHLFTDDTFSKAWMYPPSLRTNDTIYAGVVLANGPAEATVSLTSCWASNTRHEIVNMKQPELQPNEITLPLIQDGCAVKSPPNLVTMVENGETSQAKFTSSVFQFVGYDTAYLYCRVRVCPLGPCPQDCDGSEPEYEYYDLDVGLGIHGDVEDESSGDEEIFDMPSFEALIGDNPNQGKETGKEYDPYKTNDGPLVAATLYRKYEYAEGIKTDREVIVEKTENVVENILGDPSLMQAVLLGLLGAACCTLVMLSIFVIKKRNREKKIVQ